MKQKERTRWEAVEMVPGMEEGWGMKVGAVWTDSLAQNQLCLVPHLECDSRAPAHSKSQSSGSDPLSSTSPELWQFSQPFPLVQSFTLIVSFKTH